LGQPDKPDMLPSGMPSFLMVGTIEPRKGHGQALAAFESLWERGTEVALVIAGSQGWLSEDFVERVSTHPEAGKRLFWCQAPSDGELARLYRSCSCLLAASMGEGYGLPIREAARQGSAILARDIPVFREVAGDAVVYFEGNNPEDIERAVGSWLELLRKNKLPDPSAIPLVTWTESARLLLEAAGLPLETSGA
jgi:glycosyltransferase involved in cell wall biosynthesis